MDQPQEAQNAAEETSQVEAPTTETTTTEGQEQPVEETASDQAAETTSQPQPEVKKPTRAEKRLQQLLERREEGNQFNQPVNPMPILNNPVLPVDQWYQPQVQPGQDITPDQYRADVTRTADDITKLRINQFQQQMAIERAFDKTVDQLEREYPALNPDAEGYNEVISEKVAKLYQQTAGKAKNPQLLKTIVDSVMDLSNQARTEGQRAVTNQLIRQEGEAAISPTGSQTVTSDFDTATKIKDPKARLKALEKILPVAS